MERTGYARGTLATRAGLTAAVPALDRVEWLTMGDMMGDMGGMEHGNGAMHGTMAGMNHGTMPMQHNMAGMNHSAMAMDHREHGVAAAAAAAAGLGKPSRK
ncbi:hypothetical protein LTR94_035042, partial [Friedmanniomyces endolithicus]